MRNHYILGLLSGLLLWMSWPTGGFAGLIFVALVPLLLAEYRIRTSGHKRGKYHLFSVAYLTFFIWNVGTTYWIWYSTHAGGAFAVLVNSLLMSIVFMLYHTVARRKPLAFSLIFLVALWLAFEKFHLEWQFSWPWLNLGNVFSEHPQWIQWYAYTGTFGGSLWIWVVNISFFHAVLFWKSSRKHAYRKIIFGVAWMVLGIFVSKYMYYGFQEEGRSFQAVVLQPNTDPYAEKYHRPLNQITSQLLRLAEPQMNDGVNFVLAPETVLSRMTTMQNFRRTQAYHMLQSFVKRHPNASILTGIDLYRVVTTPTPTSNPFSDAKDRWYESYNAALMISDSFPEQLYYKSKLVVGVEHFPYKSLLLPLFGDILIAQGSSPNDLTPQKEATVMRQPASGIKVAPVICYESIYGEHVARFIRNGAGFIGIITNDSWWGDTPGHRQLLSYARLRAIETHREIARSANSGISAFINARGDLLGTLPYNTEGALRGVLHERNDVTFYVRYGDYIARVSGFVAVLFFLIGVFVRKKYREAGL